MNEQENPGQRGIVAYIQKNSSLPRIIPIERMNTLFSCEGLAVSDMVNCANTIADKVRENGDVMEQIHNISPEQAMLGEVPLAMEDAVMDSMEAT